MTYLYFDGLGLGIMVHMYIFCLLWAHVELYTSINTYKKINEVTLTFRDSVKIAGFMILES